MRALVTLLAGLAFALPVQAKLTVGIALHPYYSYVAQVAGEKATILPLVDAGFNPHNYQAQPQDMRRLAEMDAFVVNGVGHDDFAMQVIQAANRPDLKVIYANAEVAVLPAMGSAVGDSAVNAHTFVGINTTIQKLYTIARELGELDPENARTYRKNARTFAGKLRAMKQKALTDIAELDTSGIKVATTHNAYGYLLQEFGIGVDAVIEPAHGVEPSASQLQGTIDRIKASGINVLFYELDMPNRFVDTIEAATGVQLYQFSHMTHGPFEADKVEREMQSNLDTLVEAIRYAAQDGKA
ncbi:zinc ABC transporter substrate-binding protein [Marinobacter hydrocarbonoclasticus]|nr:zinc ABC transporter substrate-binding protein [Marinobacter nauticus]